MKCFVFQKNLESMATYRKVQYLLPPVPIHLKLLLNSDIGFAEHPNTVQKPYRCLHRAGFLVLFILRLRDVV